MGYSETSMRSPEKSLACFQPNLDPLWVFIVASKLEFQVSLYCSFFCFGLNHYIVATSYFLPNIVKIAATPRLGHIVNPCKSYAI